MTLFDMTGKVAVITGSTRGIGRAIAERMAEHGAKVVISSRKQQVCDEVAKAINDKAGKQVALSVAANISTKDDLKHLVEETNRVFGKIDTLVCNAASNPYYGPQAGISDDQFRKILDNNIVANHWLISLVVPQMIERINTEHAGKDVIAVAHGGTIKAAIGLALGNQPEKGLAFTIDNCSVTRLDHLASDGHQGWRIPMVNQQPWIADASHNAMHQPAGPEIATASKFG